MSRLVVLLAAVALVATACGGSASTQETVEGGVPFDQAFIDAMVPHHREAIGMAQAALARGLTQPELKTIADDIVGTQQAEIDQMLAWREEWFGSRMLGPILPDVLGVPRSALGMRHGSADAVAGAIDADAAFAAMMTTHHRGAIAMAEAARERAEHDDVKGLAEAVIAAQEREVALMEPHAMAEHHG